MAGIERICRELSEWTIVFWKGPSLTVEGRRINSCRVLIRNNMSTSSIFSFVLRGQTKHWCCNILCNLVHHTARKITDILTWSDHALVIVPLKWNETMSRMWISQCAIYCRCHLDQVRFTNTAWHKYNKVNSGGAKSIRFLIMLWRNPPLATRHVWIKFHSEKIQGCESCLACILTACVGFATLTALLNWLADSGNSVPHSHFAVLFRWCLLFSVYVVRPDLKTS